MSGARANTLDRRPVLVAPTSRRMAASVGRVSDGARLVICPRGLAPARLPDIAANARANTTLSDLEAIIASAVGRQGIEPDGFEPQPGSPERDRDEGTDSPG